MCCPSPKKSIARSYDIPSEMLCGRYLLTCFVQSVMTYARTHEINLNRSSRTHPFFPERFRQGFIFPNPCGKNSDFGRTVGKRILQIVKFTWF